MGDLENNLSTILSEIKAMDCPNGEPKIIAVSKKQPLEKIRALHARMQCSYFFQGLFF